MADTSETIINRVKELKKKVIPNKGKLILFGSQARKEATPDSDWDMLILLEKKKLSSSDFDTYAYPFVELGWQLGEYFSMKLYTSSDWMKRCGTPFFKSIEKEGIEL